MYTTDNKNDFISFVYPCSCFLPNFTLAIDNALKCGGYLFIRLYMVPYQ